MVGRANPQIANTDRVFIFDTTLRDGEQCPGATMTFEEKLEVADFLDAMGRRHHRGRLSDRIGGRLLRRVRDRQARSRSRWCAGCRVRASSTSIGAGEAVKHAARPRIHTFIATSPVHRKHKLQKIGGARCWRWCTSRSPARATGCEDVEWTRGGRHAHRDRLSLPLRGDGASRPAPPPSTCPTRSAMPRPRNTTRCSAP